MTHRKTDVYRSETEEAVQNKIYCLYSVATAYPKEWGKPKQSDQDLLRKDSAVFSDLILNSSTYERTFVEPFIWPRVFMKPYG